MRRWGAIATFGAVFALLLATLAPTVTFWDAGEFIATAFILGVPHPPGTPLFVLIGRSWILLPPALHPALKMNLLSALCGGGSAALYFLVVARILGMGEDSKGTGRARALMILGGAGAAALLSSFGATVWENSTEAEVYAIATMTIALLTYLLVRWRERWGTGGDIRILLLIVYLLGLSVGNHLMALLAGPAVIMGILAHLWDRERGYILSLLGGALSLYLVTLKGLDPQGMGAGHAVVSWGWFVVGGMGLVASLAWMRQVGTLGLFGWGVALFALGLSVHIYLPVRAALRPAINEADPVSWQAFWMVLTRNQYGSRPLFPRTADFFQYQLPLYVTYFLQQYGTRWLSALLAGVGLLGAWDHARRDRVSFGYFLTLFLLTSIGLVFYLNFKLGHTQALDKFPNPDDHEVRERDYFFIVSFAFFSLWVGLGLAALLRGAGRLREAGRRWALPLEAAALAALVAAPTATIALNYRDNDRSGNYIPWDYAYDILQSSEPYGVVFTNGDNDTFPLWFLQEVEKVRCDVLVVNLSLLNTPWYIRQLRDRELPQPSTLPRELFVRAPGLSLPPPETAPRERAIRYTDEEIERDLFPRRIAGGATFRLRDLVVQYPEETVFRTQDLMVLHILQTNLGKRPVYFAVTVSDDNKVGLFPYLLMQGLLYRIVERRCQDLAREDSNVGFVPETNTYIDMPRTAALLDGAYRYRGMFDSGVHKDSNTRKLLNNFAAAYSYLARARMSLGQPGEAMAAYRGAARFSEDPGRFNFLLASLSAQMRRYREADSLLELYRQGLSPEKRDDPRLSTQLGYFALEGGDTAKALEYIRRGVDGAPGFRAGYLEMARIYRAQGREDEAREVLQEYLLRNPEDAKFRAEVEGKGTAGAGG